MSVPDAKPILSAFRAPGETEWRAVTAAKEAEDQKGNAGKGDDLKNMLLASLQMEHLVVLAGSGCSQSADGPSMLDLWDGAVGKEPTGTASTIAAKVNHDLADKNIETFLSRIEAFLHVNGDKEVTEFLNASKKVILDRCSGFLKTEKLEAHKTFLHRLSRRRTRDQRLKVFTTNYDLCFERAAGELGGVALDGFSFSAPRRYDPRFFSYDIVRRPRNGDDLGSYLEGVFLLYKLHGSVNWARDDGREIFEKAAPKPEEACLIYPARGKYQQSFTQPHLESMAQYLAALREPNIYAAPHRFIALLPRLMERDEPSDEPVTLNLGTVDVAHESTVSIKPERLFGRHCAILGATGGGKSWTTARIIEECIEHNAKLILIDATGEYREFAGSAVKHCHLGDPVEVAAGSAAASLPPTSFLESDFVALFEPAGKVQGPKLRAAMRSLRLANLKPDLAPNGYIEKINQSKVAIEKAENEFDVARKLEDPRQPFDVRMVVKQIEQECVYPEGFGAQKGQKDSTKWGGEDGNYSHCLSLVARINGVLTSPAFACVFNAGDDTPALTSIIDDFATGSARLLRICLSGIAYEYHAREIIANAIGRHLLTKARAGAFQQRPTVVMVDEAHNFLGRHIGTEDYAARLDAFELIAKEGRKYGLNICLASQRPRDITEDVLSQMGTLIVHRLTNERDREVVERACGEIDRAASAFLPNLRPGEAAIIGTDFPIPLTIQIHAPATKPKSDGPKYQEHWAAKLPSAKV